MSNTATETNRHETIAVEMTRGEWEWLLSAAYMGLSHVVYEEEKVAAIRTVEQALGIKAE